MASYNDFQWKETQSGIWTRHCDEPEIAYATLFKLFEATGRSFFHITGFLDVKIAVHTDDEVKTALTKAWLALRYNQPMIASKTRIVDRKAKIFLREYHVNSRDWVERTLVHVAKGQTGDEFVNSDPPAPPLPTLYVITPPSGSADGQRTLVLRSPHDIIDGIGTLHLFNKLVIFLSEALAQGDAFKFAALDGSEVKNLSPPYRVAAQVPAEPTAAVKARMEELKEQGGVDARKSGEPEAEILGLPFNNLGAPPGKHQRVALSFDAGQTRQLVQKCKEVGATPTHVFHAALALTLRDLAKRTDKARPVQYVSYILCNLRHACVPPYNGPAYAAAVYHSISAQKLVVPMTAPPKSLDTAPAQKEQRDEFLHVVDLMKKFYHVVRDDEDHPAMTPYIWSNLTPPLPEDLISVPPPKELATVSISSMGRIDGIITARQGNVEVRDAWVTGEELGTGLGLFLGTVGGKLSLSAAYNDAYHGPEEVMAFLRRCEEIISTSFDIGLKGV